MWAKRIPNLSKPMPNQSRPSSPYYAYSGLEHSSTGAELILKPKEERIYDLRKV
jgi:hypothetical protein